MTAKIYVPRGADKVLTYTFPSTVSFTGFNGTFSVYSELNGTTLLTFTTTPSPLGSEVAFLDNSLTVTIKKEDIDALPVDSTDSENPSVLFFDLFTLSPDDNTSKVHGGAFIVQPFGSSVTVGGSDINVTLDGDEYEVVVEGGSSYVNSALYDLSNVSGEDFGSKLVAISVSQAPRPAIIGRATATFDVEDFYSSADTGRTDHNQALANVVAALNANGSGRLLLQRPLSGLVTPQTITASHVEVVGSRSSTLSKSSTTGNLLSFSGQFVHCRELFFEGVGTHTGGYFLYGSSSGQFEVDGLRSIGGYSIVYVDGAESVVHDFQCYDMAMDAVRFSPGFAGQGRVSRGRCAVPANNTNQGSGVYVTGGDTVVLSDVDFTSFKIPVRVEPAAGTFLRNLNMTDVFSDGYGRTDGNGGMLINGTNSGAELVRIVAENTWSSAASGVGLRMLGVISASFVNHRAIANGQHGVQLSGSPNPSYIEFIGGTFAGNSVGNSNVYDDFHVDDNTSNFSVRGGVYGFTPDLTILGLSNSVRRPIYIEGTNHSNYEIEPFRVIDGVSGGGIDQGTGTGKRVSFGVNARCLTPYTPTVTAETGTPTTLGSLSGNYQVDGDLVTYNFTVNVTTVGTANGGLYVSLPFASKTNIVSMGTFKELNVTGKSGSAVVESGGTIVKLNNYDNTPPWANGGGYSGTIQYWKA